MRIAVDTVTQDILANAFTSVAEEMAVIEYRSSFSPIIREMLDFNCGVFRRAFRGPSVGGGALDAVAQLAGDWFERHLRCTE